MMEEIDCPHCGGTGKVAEDFLTDEHVKDVFSDYCEIFELHKCYGVEAYREYAGDTIQITQDTSARGCHSTEEYTLPRSYFTRDEKRRRALMVRDHIALQQREERQRLKKRCDELEQLEKRAQTLRKEIFGE